MNDSDSTELAQTVSAALPGHLIRRLHQVATKVFQQHMKDAGLDLTPIQFSALDALASLPGIDQARLAKTIGKDKATIGAVVDRLVTKGLVLREVSPRDKRARVLVLSEAGAALIAEVSPTVTALQRQILPGLSEAEYAQFIALAAKATHAAEALWDDAG